MKFTEGELIRNKNTGKPYFICKITNVCILVTNPVEKNDPCELYAILPKDYAHYVRDLDMKCVTIHPWGYWEDNYNVFYQL